MVGSWLGVLVHGSEMIKVVEGRLMSRLVHGGWLTVKVTVRAMTWQSRSGKGIRGRVGSGNG